MRISLCSIFVPVLAVSTLPYFWRVGQTSLLFTAPLVMRIMKVMYRKCILKCIIDTHCDLTIDIMHHMI